MNLKTVKPGYLTIAASNFDARPMTYLEGETRLGYEPDVARAVCAKLGFEPVWFNVPWVDFYPTLAAKQCDVVWFNQAITEERRTRANFTQPYGVFDEAVLVQTKRNIYSAADLVGLRVGGLATSTNLQLAESFGDVEIVPFPGNDHVLPEMLEALRRGDIDALVDDELVLIAAAKIDPNLRIAFTVPTQIPFGIAVHQDNLDLLRSLDDALTALIQEGKLAELWHCWIPEKEFPIQLLSRYQCTNGDRDESYRKST
jgi:ABC-type amino acid transport substrate-binding protein